MHLTFSHGTCSRNHHILKQVSLNEFTRENIFAEQLKLYKRKILQCLQEKQHHLLVGL